MLKKLIEKIFPKKSDWIDVGIYYNSPNYHLSQMRIDVNNKKSFRNVKLGVSINIEKNNISTNILSTNKNDVFKN